MATLSKKDLTDARNGIYECRELQKEIDRMKACGLNCQEQEAQTQLLLDYFQKVINNYSQQSPAQQT